MINSVDPILHTTVAPQSGGSCVVLVQSMNRDATCCIPSGISRVCGKIKAKQEDVWGSMPWRHIVALQAFYGPIYSQGCEIQIPGDLNRVHNKTRMIYEDPFHGCLSLCHGGTTKLGFVVFYGPIYAWEGNMTCRISDHVKRICEKTRMYEDQCHGSLFFAS